MKVAVFLDEDGHFIVHDFFKRADVIKTLRTSFPDYFHASLNYKDDEFDNMMMEMSPEGYEMVMGDFVQRGIFEIVEINLD